MTLRRREKLVPGASPWDFWAMQELLRTNDPVLISYVEAILTGERVEYMVADQHMSVLEGSVGFIRRRILVLADDAAIARRALEEAGLGAELSPY